MGRASVEKQVISLQWRSKDLRFMSDAYEMGPGKDVQTWTVWKVTKYNVVNDTIEMIYVYSFTEVLKISCNTVHMRWSWNLPCTFPNPKSGGTSNVVKLFNREEAMYTCVVPALRANYIAIVFLPTAYLCECTKEVSVKVRVCEILSCFSCCAIYRRSGNFRVMKNSHVHFSRSSHHREIIILTAKVSRCTVVSCWLVSCSVSYSCLIPVKNNEGPEGNARMWCKLLNAFWDNKMIVVDFIRMHEHLTLETCCVYRYMINIYYTLN